MTRILRSDFEQNIARNVLQKPKLFWRYAKSRLKTRQNIPTLENPDRSTATTTKEKANSLNEFFCSVFTTKRLNNILELSEVRGQTGLVNASNGRVLNVVVKLSKGVKDKSNRICFIIMFNML